MDIYSENKLICYQYNSSHKNKIIAKGEKRARNVHDIHRENFVYRRIEIAFQKIYMFCQKIKKKKDWLQKGIPQYFLLLSFERSQGKADLQVESPKVLLTCLQAPGAQPE